MKTLAQRGRMGGRLGGPARARALSSARRTEVARTAARARWAPKLHAFSGRPRDPEELLAFVAFYGAKTARGNVYDLEEAALRAVMAAQRMPDLARMLPVFLWRVRERLDVRRLVRLAKSAMERASLGYFLELTSSLGSGTGYDAEVARLRPLPEPVFFFVGDNPFMRLLDQERTPPAALRWGLLTGVPTDDFAAHFAKVSHL